MSKNDPTGKQHATVTKTSSNGASGTELLTPKNLLSGLKGVLADCAANMSNSDAVGSGKGTRTQSMRAGVDGSVNLKTSPSSSTNYGG